MATSVLTSNDNQYNTNTNTNTNLIHPLTEDQDQLHPPIRRNSGRKKSKGGEQKKKQPQRGMGVEKLERLRQQEMWKKMTQICTTTNQNSCFPFADYNPSTLISSSVPPTQFSKMCPNVSFGHAGLNQNQNQSYLGLHGVGGLASDQFHTNLFGVGGSMNSSSSRVVKPAQSEILNELSSNPNAVNCLSQHCNTCHKKKRVSGDNLACGRLRNDMYNLQMSPVSECGFLNLNICDNQSVINQENQILTTKPPQTGCAARNGRPGVEVVAVHRKGTSSSSEKGSVVMEYEFFPDGSRKEESHDNDDLVMMKVMGGTTTSAEPSAFDASTSIDLSLKLSY